MFYAELHRDSIFLRTHLACKAFALYACAKHNLSNKTSFPVPSLSSACVQMCAHMHAHTCVHTHAHTHISDASGQEGKSASLLNLHCPLKSSTFG